MGGNKIGGQKAAATNLARDPNFYKKIGRKGGLITGPGQGFGSNSKRRNELLGALGGINRTKRELNTEEYQDLLQRKNAILEELQQLDKQKEME